jgi:tetratricopeptide (TPR) repeat protein
VSSGVNENAKEPLDPQSSPTVTFTGSPASGSEHPAVWGHFRDLKPIGGGGFGTVYRAWDTQLHREVALKLLAPRGDAEQDQAEAIQEARMMARVRHPNIVPVYGVSTVEGRVGFWSELIEGSSLASVVKNEGAMDARTAASVVAELCKAVAAMHAAGILHRDIKAENALRDSTGRVLLTDFGLSRDPGSKLFGGTLVYMAPEQLKGFPATPSSDVYALGVLLYFLVSGEFPASGGIEQLRKAMAEGQTRPLAEVRAGLPKAFLDIVGRAVSLQPEARFATAEGMLMALEAFLGASSPIVRRKASRRKEILVACSVIAAAGVVWPLLNHKRAGASKLEEQGQALLARRDKPGNAEAAAKLLSQAVAADPKSALAHAELADALWAQYLQGSDQKVKQQLREQAIAQADQAAELDSDSAQVFVIEGRIHQGTGKLNAAVEDLNRALKLDRRNAAVYRELGQIYNKEGRDADADAAYQQAIDLDPDYWGNYNERGRWLQNKGRLNEAAAEYEKARSRTPDNTFVLNNLARVWRDQNRLDEARHLLEQSIKLAPKDAAGYNGLGYTLMLLGQYDAAAAQYEVAVKLNPGSYNAWSSLASAIEYGAGGIEKARPAYKKAIELAEAEYKNNSTNAGLDASLGLWLAAVGDRDQALTLLRKALALAPHERDALEAVGEGYEILGMRDKALPLILEALSRGFSADLLKRSPDLRQLINDSRFRWPEPIAGKPDVAAPAAKGR